MKILLPIPQVDELLLQQPSDVPASLTLAHTHIASNIFYGHSKPPTEDALKLYDLPVAWAGSFLV